MENSTTLFSGKGSNAEKVQDSETSMLVSKKADKNYLDDSERTRKSCLDVVFELLDTTAGTSSSNSLPESVRLLESQLQVERHRSNVLRQEADLFVEEWIIGVAHDRVRGIECHPVIVIERRTELEPPW